MKEFWDFSLVSDDTVVDQAQGTSLTADTHPDDPYYGATIDVPDYSIQFAQPVSFANVEVDEFETVVNEYAPGNQSGSVAVSLDESGFFVAWGDKSGRDGNAGGIFGRFLDKTGQPLGPDIQVSSDTFSHLAMDDQAGVQLAWLDSGEILAVWQSGYHQDGSFNGIFGQKLATDGTKIGSDFLINEVTAGSQSNPHVSPITGAVYSGLQRLRELSVVFLMIQERVVPSLPLWVVVPLRMQGHRAGGRQFRCGLPLEWPTLLRSRENIRLVRARTFCWLFE